MNCPICSGESGKKYFPFCSGRCADVDLGRWLSGTYALPQSADEDTVLAEREELDLREQ